jgi:hypothetical protein
LSNDSAESVRCELGRSPVLTVVFLAIHGGAIGLTLLLPLAWGWRAVMAAVIASSLIHALRRHAWRRGSRAVTAIHIDDEGGLELRRGDGTWHAANRRSPAVFAPLVLLRWRIEGDLFWRRLVIPADAVERNCFRRVRVALRRRSSPG